MKYYDYPEFKHLHPSLQPDPPPEPIDWNLIAEITPTAFSIICWLLWATYLLIPSMFGLHDAAMFSTANNTVFVLMGFVLCMATSTAIRAGHGARAVCFGLGIFLLSYWF